MTAPVPLAVDGTSYGSAMTGAARRTSCLLPVLAARGWRPVLFVGRGAARSLDFLAGVETVRLPVPRSPGPLRSAAGRLLIPGPLRRRGCRLLLTEVPPPPSGIPFVLTVHDTRAWDAPKLLPWGRRWWMRRVTPPALDRAAAVVTVSEWSGERLAARFPGCRPAVVPNGCDHLPAPPAGQPPENPVMLAVGPWHRHKGLDTLLEAYSTLRREARGPLLPLVLTGGPKPGLPPGVECRTVDDPGLVGLLARAAVVIRPSRFEGFDLPLGEALAAGCPVVASDLPVHRELAGDAADYFPPGDAVALAAALRLGLTRGRQAGEDEERRRRVAGFSWEGAGRAMDRVLRTAIESGPLPWTRISPKS